MGVRSGFSTTLRRCVQRMIRPVERRAPRPSRRAGAPGTPPAEVLRPARGFTSRDLPIAFGGPVFLRRGQQGVLQAATYLSLAVARFFRAATASGRESADGRDGLLLLAHRAEGRSS